MKGVVLVMGMVVAIGIAITWLNALDQAKRNPPAVNSPSVEEKK